MVTFRQILDSGLALQKKIEKNKNALHKLAKEKLKLATRANQLLIKKQDYIIDFGETLGTRKFNMDWDVIKNKSNKVSEKMAAVRESIHQFAEEGFELLEDYRTQTKTPLPANLSKLNIYFEKEYKKMTK
jgi:hypothetical protein